MKNKSLREKFKNNAQVTPLYRKVNQKNVLVSVHSTYNLDGDDFTVKREISSKINQNRKRQDSILPGAGPSRGSKTVINKVYNLRNNDINEFEMIGNAENSKLSNKNNENVHQLVQADNLTVPSYVSTRIYRDFRGIGCDRSSFRK